MGLIYKATSPSGKIYIGQTSGRLDKRISMHRSKAKNSVRRHKFYTALNKYGAEVQWSILYNDVPDDLLDAMEIWVIESYDSFGNGYNSTIGGSTTRGYKFSEASKEKMRQAKVGKSLSSSHRCNMSKSHKGKPGARHTEETKRKLSEIAKKRPKRLMSESAKRKISESKTLWWAARRESCNG